MSDEPKCPKCASEFTYRDGSLFICPECAFEWPTDSIPVMAGEEEAFVVRDAYGNLLQEGDSVSVIKDLKVKGSSLVVKVGTKVRNIHLVESNDGHNISCRIEGIGEMNLKSEFVKKA